MSLMSETSETPTVRSSTATVPAPAAEPALVVHKTPRVFLAAAWVAIVAGVVFIVSIIFFALITILVVVFVVLYFRYLDAKAENRLEDGIDPAWLTQSPPRASVEA